jgi:hypothetical protein
MIEIFDINLFGINLIFSVILLAFICELINSLLGGGHGTIITPLLLLLGFAPLSIVPSVLLAEIISGFLVSVAHHKVGNVDFRMNSAHLKVALLLGICSVIGVLLAVVIAINVSTFILEIYIGLLVLSVGVITLVTLNRKFKFSWRKIFGLGIFAAFNKGISGGGYGPIITVGQILTGFNSKEAVSTSSLAKSLACLVGIIAYYVLSKDVNWFLAPSLIVGAVVSVPFSAFIVKKMYEKSLRIFIGLLTISLGVATLIKIFLI